MNNIEADGTCPFMIENQRGLFPNQDWLGTAGNGLPESPELSGDDGTWLPDVQFGLFGSDKALRTRKPKPQQLEMFSARDLVQFTHAHPVLPDRVTMILSVQETRTPAEIEADKLREANAKTEPLP